MQVVEKSNEGLSRVIAVTIPVAELNQKLDAKLKEVAPQMKLKGFRPGKVPMSHVKKTFGRDLMGEIVNDALNTSSQKALDDAKVRPAAPAEMKLTSDMEKVIAGTEDLAYEMSLEVMPDFTPTDIKKLKLERPTYEATDADLDEALTELAGQAKSYEDKKGKTVKAAEGDEVTIDFLGKLDGEPFEGGAAEDTQLVIGSNRFIPGFEEQLKGAKVLLLGMTYKPDIADLRESPSLDVFEILLEEQADVAFFDPHVNSLRAAGTVHEGAADLNAALAEADVAILLQAHKAFDLTKIAAGTKVLFDTRGVASGDSVVRL
jgi:FKBP-type peptidyl-prolyl cis-trans isomerase